METYLKPVKYNVGRPGRVLGDSRDDGASERQFSLRGVALVPNG